MKKRILSTVLALIISLLLLPCAALAEELKLNFSTPPIISDLQIIEEDGSAYLQLKLTTPDDVYSVLDILDFFEKRHYIKMLQASVSLEGGASQLLDMSFVGEGSKWSGKWRTAAVSGLSVDSWVELRARYAGEDDGGKPVLSEWSELLSIHEPGAEPEDEPVEFNAHDWAKPELTEADGLGLIPADLRSADLTQPITRAEFAAVSVKVYEALSGLTAEPAAENPFTDTADVEVLKALNVGVTNGTSATEFSPDALLNREQAATMLSRVYKKAAFDGWTMGTDGDFAEAFRALFTMPEAFTDDADISSWARDSVYFMAANGILKGMEGGTFQPRAVTEEQQIAGYAQATREQAILIAVRLVKNMGT